MGGTAPCKRRYRELSEQVFFAFAQFFPDRSDLVVGLFLAELAVALQGHD
jgi:hypothetical protein